MSYSFHFALFPQSMSTESHPIDLSSDIEIEDAMSSTTPIVPPTLPTPPLPLPARSEDTEAFYEEEVAPTPQISPRASPLVTRAPTESLSHTTPVSTEPTLMFRRKKTIRVASKRVRRATTTIQISVIPAPPPPSDLPPATPETTPSPTLLLPPKKRARLTSVTTPTTQLSDAPLPSQYHVGECSRAVAARVPTLTTLDAQLGEHQELIDQLRDELPEIRDRAVQTQEAQRDDHLELAVLRERVTAMEGREIASQIHIGHLGEIIVAMDREIRRLRGGPGGPGAPGGSGAPGGA